MQLRSYTESFDAEKVAAITKLIEDLNEIGKYPTGYRLYALEIENCLSVGLLMAAVSVSASLLELFMRDLFVAFLIDNQHDGNIALMAKLEREAEEDRKLGFNAILDELRDAKQPNSEALLLDSEDITKLKEFYKKTRIPFAHGLVRRLTSKFDDEGISDLFALLARRFDLESRIEDEAVDEVSFVVKILKKYHLGLLAHYEKTDEPNVG